MFRYLTVVSLVGTVAASAQCDVSGQWVMSRAGAHNIPSKDNMTITSGDGKSFNVSCDTEAWKVAQGRLSASFNTDAWDGQVVIDFPPHGIKPAIQNTGKASFNPTDCTDLKIYWSDGSVWCKGLQIGGMDCGGGSPPPEPISTVYVLFSNHLDVGYTQNENGSCAGAVVNQYFTQHFPKAINTSREFRSKTNRTYRWMTQSWLVDVYRHCDKTVINRFGGPSSDLICPTEEELAAFEEVVKLGDVVWHAFPHNAEPEMYDEGLFLSALNLTFRQDDYYGHPHRLTLSQRDVPGLTRASIRLLSKYGVKAVSVGENNAVAPVNVPNIFLWRDNSTDTEVVALFHPRGYGSTPPMDRPTEAELDKMSEGIQAGGGVDYSDCVTMPAAGVAICYAWNSDNQGPHDFDDAMDIFDTVEKMFPNASVVASDAFDDFIRAVIPVKDLLPVVTAEIGDTWIYGADSDPLKVAQYRAVLRLRSECIARGECDPTDPQFQTFERLLIKLGEHTWGWNGGQSRIKDWSNPEFQQALATDPNFYTSPWTWSEQRMFIDNAIQALPDSHFKSALLAELSEIQPTRVDQTGFSPASDPTAPIQLPGGGSVAFDLTGAIIHLQTSDSSANWASQDKPLARLWYENMDSAYFEDFSKDYNIAKIATNFIKPGLSLSSISSNFTMTKLLTASLGAGVTKVLVELKISTSDAHESRGAPATAEILYEIGSVQDGPGLLLNMTVQWFNKTSCHAPETIWLSSRPIVGSSDGWVVSKMGQPINPLDADLSASNWQTRTCSPRGTTCGVHLHAVDEGGVAYTGQEGTFAVQSVDSALVSIGSARSVPTPLSAPDPKIGGVHFALVGNIWNTNYPMWYPFEDGDEASKFRFTLRVV